jgi:imidazole glycerol-phosphate synthase subunit HisH
MRFLIFNYGAGNLFSIQSALRKEGVTPEVTETGAGIDDADALVLPGVGSFDQAAKALPMDSLREKIGAGKPVLGICLGLQLFFDSSEEGSSKGLSLIKGRVKKFPSTVKVPQIGWNTVDVRGDGRLVEGLSPNTWVYYVNSFYPETKGAWVVATTDYGVQYPAVVEQGNICGTQFHPEKSGPAGSRILQNFIRSVKK